MVQRDNHKADSPRKLGCVSQLEKGINDYIEHWNNSGERFCGIKTAEDIKQAISMACF